MRACALADAPDRRRQYRNIAALRDLLHGRFCLFAFETASVKKGEAKATVRPSTCQLAKAVFKARQKEAQFTVAMKSRLAVSSSEMRSILSLSWTFLALLLVAPIAVLSQPSQEKPVAAEPGYARFLLPQGKSAMQSVTIYSNEASPFKVLDVTSPAGWITVKFHKAEAGERVAKGQAANAQYRLDISVNGSAATVGPIAEWLTLKTNSSTTPEFRIPVSGMIRPAGTPTPHPGSEGRVEGIVVDAGGSPLGDVTVSVIRPDGKIYDVAQTTDSRGMFRLLILDATKTYNVHLEKPGYTPLDQDLQPKVGEMIHVTFTLRSK